MEQRLLAGFGRADVTPGYPIPLRGYGNSIKRMSERILDHIYLTCVAFTDADGETALLFSVDASAPGTPSTPRFRPAVSRAVGVPVDHIILAGTHSHSGPDLACTEWDRLEEYLQLTENAYVQAAREAMADRAPARILAASAETEKLNHVRRYVLENGTYAGDNYGDFKSAPIARHESEPDRRMQLVKLVREGKPDVLLVNFQVHQTLTGGMQNRDLSADITGAMRRIVERELGCRMAYFTGGAGNLNPTSRIPGEALTPMKDLQVNGQAIAGYALRAEGTYRELGPGRVSVRQRVRQFDANHAGDGKLELARALWDEYQQTGDRPAVTKKARAAGLNSVYHAEAILINAQLPPTQEMELNAFSVGELAFCCAPVEMFDSTCRTIMDPSPFAVTFMVTCCHEAKDYVPAMIGYEHGGYSADSSRFTAGTAEKMAEQFRQMLDELCAEERA